MKVFWSWQSDTSGKTGRHFVRDCLSAAIERLRQPNDVEEPTTRETREELHLDHDRKGVTGSPDLVATILAKIDEAAVFICDVTTVAKSTTTNSKGEESQRYFINSNVAIEYGYALRNLRDERILMVQNTFYGERETLPFDLRHKAGPIQYHLSPDASSPEIKKAATDLTEKFAAALQPFVESGDQRRSHTRFERTLYSRPALFAEPNEVIARFGADIGRFLGRAEDDDQREYRFDEETVFFLRLVPTKSLPTPLKLAILDEVMNTRKVLLPTRNAGAPFVDRNRHGAIGYEPHGTSTTPTAFTQLFQNGEIWGASTEVFTKVRLGSLILMPNVPNIARHTLQNWIEVASKFGVELPVEIVIGLVGIEGFYLPRDQRGAVAGPIRRNECIIERVANNPAAIEKIVREFHDELWDAAGATAPG